MFKIKEKLEKSLGKSGSEKSFLKLLRPDTSFQPSIVGPNAEDQEDFYAHSQKEITNAMLEAERVKAIAVMAWQQQKQRLC